MNAFAQRIKTLRLTKGLTQTELGEKLGMAYMAVFNWESGRLPRPNKLPKIARILGVEPEELAKLWMEVSLEKERKEK